MDALAGTEIVALETLTGFDRVMLRGERRVLSKADIESTIDRNGDSWLSLIDDEDAQRRRWNVHAFARVEALPEPVLPYRRGDQLWSDLREAARLKAWSLQDDAERIAALREVEGVYGPPLSGTTILGEYNPDARDRSAWT